MDGRPFMLVSDTELAVLVDALHDRVRMLQCRVGGDVLSREGAKEMKLPSHLQESMATKALENRLLLDMAQDVERTVRTEYDRRLRR